MSLLGVKIPKGITCPKWEPITEGKKGCRHYDPNDGKQGLCLLPDEYICVEWQKANQHLMSVPPVTTRPAPAATPQAAGQLHLGGAPLGTQKPHQRSARPASGQNSAPVPLDPSPNVLVSISPEQVDELERAGLEVQLISESELIPDIWLVKKYTGKSRTEITYQSASTIRMIADVFPGARIVAINKPEE
jgi:hypothetical protein